MHLVYRMSVAPLVASHILVCQNRDSKSFTDNELLFVPVAQNHRLPVRIRVLPHKTNVQICSQLCDLACSSIEGEATYSQMVADIHTNCLQDNLLSHQTSAKCEHKTLLLFDYLHNHMHIPCYQIEDGLLCKLCPGSGPNLPEHHNLYLPICVVHVGSEVICGYWLPNSAVYNLWQCITHSPAMLQQKRDNTALIILHILHALSTLEKTGLIIPSLPLSSFKIDNKGWTIFDFVDIFIQRSTICDAKSDEKPSENDDPSEELGNPTISKLSGVHKMPLWEATRRWCNWEMSNYEYLMYLNSVAGRKMGQAHNHPIFPWVCSFSMREGGWRDLTQTKYRLTKGDQQLDEAYKHSTGGGTNHHVAELLSDLAYYVYKARVTPKNILCRYVRSQWVPEEYPVSMKRMFEWSPDECIPEFYSDPEIFNSIHDDLPNIQLPSWCGDGDDFVTWHMSMLECDWVSQRLHHWIDLVFGCKLRGSGARLCKNVHLSLVDEHEELRDHGPVQLFHALHPQKKSTQEESVVYGLEDALNLAMNPLYQVMKQPHESVTGQSQQIDLIGLVAQIRKKYREVVCPTVIIHIGEISMLLLQIVLPPAAHLFPRFFEHSKKLEAMRTVFKQRKHELLRLLRPLIERTLFVDEETCINDVRNLLCANVVQPLQTTIYLPYHIFWVYHVYSVINQLDQSHLDASLRVLSGSKMDISHMDDISEKKVRLVTDLVEKVWQNADRGLTRLLRVVARQLLQNAFTCVSATWSLFMPLSNLCNKSELIELFGDRLMAVYNVDEPYSRKHLKIYYRTFVNGVVVRFGTDYFLKHLVIPLVEACSGDRNSLVMNCEQYCLHLVNNTPLCSQENAPISSQTSPRIDPPLTSLKSSPGSPSKLRYSQSFDGVAEEIIDRNDERDRCANLVEGKLDFGDTQEVSSVALESILWLAHRCGPVLTSTYITRNVLRMLCTAFTYTKIENGSAEKSAHRLLQCLIHISSIYGDAFMIGQYIPFCVDIVNQASKRMSPSVESGLVACAMLVDVLLPHLTDKQLIDNLEDPLVDGIIFPCVRVVSSLRQTFHHVQVRLSCALRLSRLLCRLGIRIGVEHVKRLLAASLQRMFCVYDIIYHWDSETGKVHVKSNADPSCPQPVFEQLKATFTPDLAAYLYKTFAAFCGRRYVQLCLANSDLVNNIVDQLSNDSNNSNSKLDQVNITHASFSSGNRLSGTTFTTEPDSTTGDEKKNAASRELQGNWLAFWKNKIVQERPSEMTINQVKLQSFVGHSSTVRKIRVLENENSFISASSDKTVKLWCLRSIGDGNVRCDAAWTYEAHRKSVLDCALVDSTRLIASTDGILHLWDPFLGAKLREFDWASSNSGSNSSAMGNTDPAIHFMRPFAVPSANLITASANDSVLRVLDTRMAKWAQELKLGGCGGQVRGLCVDPGGTWTAVTRSSGQVIVMDIRTGRLAAARNNEANEPCPLVEHFMHDKFLAVHPDQSLSVFSYKGELLTKLPGRFMHFQYNRVTSWGAHESLSCLTTCGEQIICGTNSNRIYIHCLASSNPVTISLKLRSELFSGNLSAMTCLPLHNIVLLGSSNGVIRLVC